MIITARRGYAADPTEVVNYVSKHDNQTLWDMISYKAAQEADLDTRVRMQAVSLATVMLGRGIAFDQQGSELLRSKSFTRDSYDSGDWFNRVDYSRRTTTTTSVCRAAAMMAAIMTLSPG